jgi:hypothetical protein
MYILFSNQCLLFIMFSNKILRLVGHSNSNHGPVELSIRVTRGIFHDIPLESIA